MHKVAMLVATFFLLSSGCNSAMRESSLSTNMDSWYKPLDEKVDQSWILVPEGAVELVSEAARSHAIELLRERSIRPLTEDQVQAMGGDPDDGPSMAFLVRGLCLQCDYGEYLVYRRKSELLVSHGSLTNRSLPMTRWPLIVHLEEEPSRVFVEVTAAE